MRVERVQEISIEDISAEGVLWQHKDVGRYPIREDCAAKGQGEITSRFADFWDSLNAKRGYSWESNPWVWALTFKRVER